MAAILALLWTQIGFLISMPDSHGRRSLYADDAQHERVQKGTLGGSGVCLCDLLYCQDGNELPACARCQAFMMNSSLAAVHMYTMLLTALVMCRSVWPALDLSF